MQHPGIAETFAEAFKLFEPGERISPSEWCARYLVLSRSVSARPGRFRPWPWQKEPMDCILDPAVSTCVLMWPAQVLGKSSVINGLVGWSISQSPANLLFIMPTIEAAQIYSKNKLGPIISDSPELARLVREETLKREKGSGGESVSLKKFPGGWLVLGGANSPIGLRSHSARRMFFDEVSIFPQSVGAEGDAIAIATKRSETFDNAFSVITSTPTVRDTCRVTMELADSDERRWHVRCEKCWGEFVIMFAHIKWEKETRPDGKKVHLPETAYLECPICGAHHDDVARTRMSLAGRWIATRPEITSKRGYWANAFISTLPAKRGFVNRMHQWASEFLRAEKRGVYFLRPWINTVLAEPFELDTDPAPDFENLYNRREAYNEMDGEIILPKDVMLLTVGADIQRDRVEAEILGTGMDGETWGVEYRIFYGNTEMPDVYAEFDRWSQKRFRHESGHMMWPACVTIDAAFKSESVYAYVKSCPRMCFATRGIRGFAPLGSNWVDRSTSDNNRLWLVKVDGAKESLYSRLRLTEKGAGYQHFPSNVQCHYDTEYFRQLTCEVIKTSSSGVKYFAKPSAESRNESLDCRILATAAVAILNPVWEKVKQSLERPPENDWRLVEHSQKQPTPEGQVTAKMSDLEAAARRALKDCPSLSRFIEL